jgi:hypothetical protein
MQACVHVRVGVHAYARTVRTRATSHDWMTLLRVLF